MHEYVKCFDETKYLSFLTKGDGLLKKYDKIVDKVSDSIKKGFDNEPVYTKKYLKTKIKAYKGKTKTNFIIMECQKINNHISNDSDISSDGCLKEGSNEEDN